MCSSNTIRNLKLFGASICLVTGRYPSKRKEDRVPLGRYSVDPARGISPREKLYVRHEGIRGEVWQSEIGGIT